MKSLLHKIAGSLAMVSVIFGVLAPTGSSQANDDIQVSVFSFPGLTEGDLSCADEVDNLEEIILRIPGYSVDDTIETLNPDDGDPTLLEMLEASRFFFVPDMETSAFNVTSETDFPESAVTDFQTWLTGGGVLVMTGTGGSKDIDFLNKITNWGLATATGLSGATRNDANADGTPFGEAELADTILGAPSATDAISKGSAPAEADFKAMWGTDTRAPVAAMTYGKGTIIYLGWDFYNAGFDGDNACLEYENPWVQDIVPAALDYAAQLSEAGLSNPTNEGGDLSYTFSEAGTTYLVVVDRDDTSPSAAQIKAGVGYTGGTVLQASNQAGAADEELTFAITGLTASSDYTAYLVTENADPAFSEITDLEFSTAPGIPSVDSVTIGDGQVSIAITPHGNETNFEYSFDGGSSWVSRSPEGVTSPWVFSGLDNGTEYSLTFRSFYNRLSGAATSAFTFTPSKAPTAPQGLQVTFGATSGATASWSAPSSDGGDAVTGYTVQLDTGSGFETISSTGTTVTIDSVWLDQTWSVRVAANNTNGSGAYATYSNTAPVPQALADPPDNSTLVTGDNQSAITATAGQAVAGTIIDGVVNPVTPTITRVTAETAADIRTETDTLITNFKNRWGGGANAPEVVTKVETDEGAKIFGLVANPEDSTPVGVPAKDVVLVTTDDEAVMLAAIKGEKPATVNSEGSLVVETGSTIGVSINGYEPNTQGELVLMSTPTVLGTFTTDSDGSFTGQAPLPDGIPAGDHTAVVITSGKVTAFGLQLAEPFVPEPDNSEQNTPSPPAAYSGPLIAGSKQTTDSEFAVAGQQTLLVVGKRLGTVSRVTIENLEAELLFVSEESLEIAIPEGLEPGTYDLQIKSSIGNLTYLQALTVKKPEPEPVKREAQLNKKINAGSFKGFVAIYALGYEGQRLSAKIGNDWVIVDPIVNNETASLARITDFTGAGVDINLKVYIDRQLVMTMPLTTK